MSVIVKVLYTHPPFEVSISNILSLLRNPLKHSKVNILVKVREKLDVLVKGTCCCVSVAKSCQTPCDPMDSSTPGSSVLHSLLELAQIHVH